MFKKNTLIIITLFLACNKHNRSNMFTKFSGMNPNEYEEGIGVSSQELSAFYPGFNIRVYCKNCDLISNNNFGFKGKLGDIKGESFVYNICVNHSLCKKCELDLLDNNKTLSVVDVVFSRCSYEWKGKLCKPIQKWNNNGNIIFDDEEKLSFHTKIISLDEPNQYRLYNKESFEWYSYLTIRCTEVCI